jgi:hypothetical protein
MIPQVALTADQGGLATVPLAPPCPSRFVGVVTAARRTRPLASALSKALHETVAGLPLPAA